ncbi:MAG: hypothetical protein QXM38_01960, partial [Candidatus Aenigmatarchaeota archaeon]
MANAYEKLALSMAGWFVNSFPEIFKPINKELQRAGINRPKKVYDSIIVFNSMIAYVISFIFISLFFVFFNF